MSDSERPEVRVRTLQLLGQRQEDDVSAWINRGRGSDMFHYGPGMKYPVSARYGVWKPDVDLNQAALLAKELHGNFDAPDEYVELLMDDQGYTASIRYGQRMEDFVAIEAETWAVALTLACIEIAARRDEEGGKSSEVIDE